MAPRAIWKGFLKVGELLCPVGLHTAVSTSERVALHMLNRGTGHRLHRQFADTETGKAVERDDQVKGYEVAPGDYVVIEPEEIAAVIPESDKTLSVETFIPCDQVDDLYFDRPYYLSPDGAAADKAYAILRDGLSKKNVAALATAILFRRVRMLLITPHDQGLVATTLNFDYEVRSATEVFEDIKAPKIKKEMLDLARHIIETKRGTFDPASFDDKYEEALVDLVRAKIEGREIKAPKAPARGNVIDLMEALRRSAGDKAAKQKGAQQKGAQQKGAKAPAKKSSVKKTPAKKTATKPKVSQTKPVQSKSTQRKTAARKTPARKTAQRKAS